MKPPKVAHILKDLVVGGIQSLLLDLFEHYRQSGQDFVFIAIGGGEAEALFREKDIPAYFLKKQLPFIDPALVWKLRKILQREKVEVAHAHHTSEGVAAWLATAKSSIKYVQSFHVAPQINNRQDEWAFKQLAQKMDAGVVPSMAQLHALKKAGYKTANMEVVHNGIWPERLKPRSERNTRQELGLGEENLLLGMVGNFYNSTRDQLTVCKALPAVFRQFPHARFVFFGGHQNEYAPGAESYRACLEFCHKAGIADKVFFPGLERDLGSVFRALDLFVYSSLHDTFAIAVAEAMMSGVPVILNDLPVLMEVSQNGKYNRVFATQNPENLASEIIAALQQPEALKEMADKAQAFALQAYSIQKHAEELNRLYGKICQRP